MNDNIKILHKDNDGEPYTCYKREEGKISTRDYYVYKCHLHKGTSNVFGKSIVEINSSEWSCCGGSKFSLLRELSVLIYEKWKQSISLEPGGQFELSGAPLEIMHQTCAEVNSHLYQEFYHPLLESNYTNLPLTFGMTVSLVNTKGSSKRSAYIGQIAEIESLMHSKVYTVASEYVLAEYIPFSTARIMEYDHVEMPHYFTLLSSILEKLKLKHLHTAKTNAWCRRRVQNNKKIKKLHDTLLFCLTELGLLAAVKIEDLQCVGIEYMAGKNSGLQSQTNKEQFTIVEAFHGGKAKIIIATWILEEGLDVQSCNVVVRFD